MPRSFLSAIAAPALLLAAAATSSPADPAGPSFSRDIRPLLSDRCFTCHGPDQNTRQAELRLDQRDAAIAAGAIEPGQPDDSPLVERIFSDDPHAVMPPPKLNKPLTALQKDLLRQWVAAGAPYEAHWSLIPVPQQVPVPAPPDPGRWIRTSIDAFVLERLRAERLEPAVEAPREKWLRRASFDLTGLPPTRAELEAFLGDDSEVAYERAVDRLLDSPAFGERMANEWLDVARYADTFGYQSDRDMSVWPWRDWVIRAFNQNLPYDQFILWQTAGDLLPSPTADQLIATAFNRLHRQTNEGGSIEEEFRVAYVADRVNTNASAFLGLTFECARCHDHKYDPIPQADFYRLSAFFSTIDEHGLYSHFTETAPTPALLLYEGEQEVQHRALLEEIRTREAELAQLREQRRAELIAKRGTPDAEVASVEPTARFSFDDMQPAGDYKPVPGKSGQAIEFGGDDAFPCKGAGPFGRVTPFTLGLWVRPAQHKPRMIVLHQSVAAEDAGYRGLALNLDEGRPTVSLVHFWPGNAIRVQARQAIPTGEWSHLAVTYDGSSHASGLRIYVNGRTVPLDVVRDALTRDILYRPEWGDSGNKSLEIALGARFRDVGFKGGAIDDLLVFNSALTPVEVARIAGSDSEPDESARFEHFLARQDDAVQAAQQQLQALRIRENDLVSQVRLLMTMRESSMPQATHILRRGAYDAPADQVLPDTPASIFPFPASFPRNRLGLAMWLIDDRNPLVSRVTVNRLWQQFFGRGLVATAEDFGSQGQLPTHPALLDWLAREFMGEGRDEGRGTRGEEQPDSPPLRKGGQGGSGEAVLKEPIGNEQKREPENGTESTGGATPPSPPFLRGGDADSLTPQTSRLTPRAWDVKALCRLIVLSATYRQASVPRNATLYVDDPDNLLLARGPRHRLTAEQIRDNALAVSGLLVDKRGGPSVMPYQPAGLWEEAGTGKSYNQAHGEGLYRRSLYTFWRRTSPPPSLMTFDATTREVCIARRERTATPLQALVLLNDPQFVEAARVLAQKLIVDHAGDVDGRIGTAFRLLTSRNARAKEVEILTRLYREQRAHFAAAPEDAQALLTVGEAPRDETLDPADHAAMTVLVKTLMSFDECVTKR